MSSLESAVTLRFIRPSRRLSSPVEFPLTPYVTCLTPLFVGGPHLHSVSVCLFRLGPEPCGACYVPPTFLIGSSWGGPRAYACSGITVWDLGMGVRYSALHSLSS